MSNYTITTNFGAKDDLPSGNAAKVIKGSEFSTEFTNIKTAVNSKADSVSPTFTGDTALNGTTTFGPDGTSTFNGTVNFTKDVTFDTNTMFVDVSENRVGIGTTSPSRVLHIKDSVPSIRLEDADNTSYGEIIYNEGSHGLLIRSDEGNTDSGSNIIFEVDGVESARIDSSGNVGIDTTNPVESLHTSGNIRLGDTAPAELYTNSSELRLGVDKNNDNTTSNITFYVNNSEKGRFDKEGDFGVGTTNPENRLHVASSGSSFATVRLDAPENTTPATFQVRAHDGLFDIRDVNQSATRLTIDASGNLLVSKTSSSISTVGGQLNADGLLVATRGGGNTAVFNRKTSSGDDADGAIVQFRKDNAIVGSIGTNENNYLYIGNDDTFLAFSQGSDLIFPRGGGGTQRDGAIDLGNSANRFKNLYLSGGVHLGGTGSANKLDDYEEGSWTMGLSDSESTPNVSSSENTVCRYVKVGDMVTLTGQLIDINKGSLSSTLKITGLPFAVKAGSTRPHGSIQINNFNTGLADKGVFIQGVGGQAYFTIKANQNSGSVGSLKGNTLASDNTSDIFFSITYIST